MAVNIGGHSAERGMYSALREQQVGSRYPLLILPAHAGPGLQMVSPPLAGFPVQNLGLRRQALQGSAWVEHLFRPSLFSQGNEKYQLPPTSTPSARPISPMSQSLLLLVTSYQISK